MATDLSNSLKIDFRLYVIQQVVFGVSEEKKVDGQELSKGGMAKHKIDFKLNISKEPPQSFCFLLLWKYEQIVDNFPHLSHPTHIALL